MGGRKSHMHLLWMVLLIVPAARGIEVGSEISCSIPDLEYLDISSLECVRCDDDRYVGCVYRVLYCREDFAAKVGMRLYDILGIRPVDFVLRHG